jgi:ABC-type molybdenum transport system ATPase subunit/photorepair protein PhrA
MDTYVDRLVFNNESAIQTGIMGESVISVDRLSYKYGKNVAVDNISFTVKRGQIFSFLGPNGAGKTTTINVLTTLLNRSFHHPFPWVFSETLNQRCRCVRILMQTKKRED